MDLRRKIDLLCGTAWAGWSCNLDLLHFVDESTEIVFVCQDMFCNYYNNVMITVSGKEEE